MLNDKQIRDHAFALMPDMRGMFRGLCATEEDAEDELHEGYHYLVTYCLPAYRGGSNVKTFALQSLRRKYYRQAKAHYKTRRHRFEAQADSDEPQGMDSIADVESPTAFARIFKAEQLRNALAVLTADERALCEAFMLHGEWHLAAEEIGVSAVKASRMLKRIRDKVSR